MVTIHMRAIGADRQRAVCQQRYRYLYQMTRVPSQVTCRRCLQRMLRAEERRRQRAAVGC